MPAVLDPPVQPVPQPPTVDGYPPLASLANEVDYEMLDGQLVERNIGWESSNIAANLLVEIGGYVRDKRLGLMGAPDAAYECFPWQPGRLRKPDVSFVANNRFPGNRRPKGNAKIPPDLAVEVLSTHDGASEIREKIEEYLRAGVRLVWVIDPVTRTVEERHGRNVRYLYEDDELDGLDVVPGFRCRVADVLGPRDEAEAATAEADATADSQE
jgi:Uma2 family endonuclease